MTVSTQNHKPIRRPNAADVICSGGSALGVVVLSATIDIVKGLSVIEGELVILR